MTARGDDVRAWLDELDELDGAGELAVRASVAARVDRGVLRALRLALPALDATAEADLWFSPLVSARTASELVFDAGVLDELRARATGAAWLPAVRATIEQAHRGAPPLLALEEQLVYLALSGAPVDRLDELLAAALLTMTDEPARAPDIAAWALHAIPRLPAAVRGRAPAWSLGWAAAAHAGYAIELGEVPAAAMFVLPAADVAIGVQRTQAALRVGGAAAGATNGVTITVPDTHPRVLVLDTTAGQQVMSFRDERVVEVPPGALVVTNLRGARWQVEERVVHDATVDVAPENGYWVVVDGANTNDLEAPFLGDRTESGFRRMQVGTLAAKQDTARALGAALARAGFSLITLGTPGVGEVVARAFWEVLAEQGSSTGVYRMLHLVAAGATPAFGERGRTLVAVEPARAAVDRADAAYTIGSSYGGSQLQTLAVEHPIPFSDLDPERGEADVSPTVTVEQLVNQLEIPAERDLQLAAMARAAASVLDVVEWGPYDERLARLVTGIPASTMALRWIVDPRRASHRLVGYLSWRAALHTEEVALEPRAPQITAALRAEIAAVRAQYDARTLEAAIAATDVAMTRWPAEAHLLAAAVCAAGMQLDPRRDAQILGADRCLRLIASLTSRHPAMARANELANHARRYEQLRAELPSGDERTALLDALVDGVRDGAQASAAQEAEVWFASGLPGTTTIALGLLLADPDPTALEIVISVLTDPVPPFVQYTALRVISAMVPRLESDQQALLYDLLLDLHTNLKLAEDSARRRLLEDLLELLRGEPAASVQTWIHNVRGADTGTLELVGPPELRRGDLVVAFADGPRPLGIYWVTSGRRTEDGNTQAFARLIVRFPEAPGIEARLSELRTLSASTSQRDTRNLRIHDRLVRVLEAIYADDPKIVAAIHHWLGEPVRPG